MASFGKLEAFRPYQDNWVEYEEQLEQFFIANGIDEDEKKRAIFLSSCGQKTYSLLRSLLAPRKPSDKTLEQLKNVIKNHLQPKPLIIAERFKFHCKKQGDNENVTQYVTELRRLSETCEFANFLEDALRDGFVCGLRNPTIQKRLLSEADLTLKKAVDMALSMEMADNEASKITGASQKEAKTYKVYQQCFRCGKTNHDAEACFYKNAKCHFCKGQGHISKMCPKKVKKPSNPPKPGKMQKKGKRKPKINMLNEHSLDQTNSDSDDPGWPLFTIRSNFNSEINVELKVAGKQCKMELDTGAALSIVSEKVYYSQLSHVKLKPSSVLLKTYTDDTVQVLGQANVNVKYGKQKENLPLYVVKGDGPALLGRNWLMKLKLDWKNINWTQQTKSVEQLLAQYTTLFDSECGAMKGIEANLTVKENSSSKFFKPRPVPFALKEKIKNELERLVDSQILEKVQTSNWATPIVPVLKPDNTVRICGDFKVTLNPVLDTTEYPLPTAEDVFQKLNGGQKFSKLDMRHAYQQICLNEKSREYVTINTHMGLYRYSRLPFGVSSSPAIFQQIMDMVLEGLESVGCILDDIIITGKNDAEHMKNLESVLHRLDKMNIKLRKDKCFFLKDEVEYFAFRVNKDGIQPSLRKVDAIMQVPEPQNKKELQSWLGIVNYYRKFIPNLSTIVEPLTHLLKNKVPWVWTTKCKEACEKVRKLLSSSDLLVHYDQNKPLLLAVDASPYGLGAVISHRIDNVEKPIAYASRTLNDTERKYSQLEKEGAAIIFGIQKFHQYLYGRKFTLVTDSKPLSLILGPKKGIPVLAASRIQRWAIQLSSYQFDIKYKNSVQNSNADALSRFPLPETAENAKFDTFLSEASVVNHIQLENLPINAKKVASETMKDENLCKLFQFTMSGWPEKTSLDKEMQYYHKFKNEFSVEEGCLLRGIRVVIPESLTGMVLETLHENHPGIVKMKSLARMHVWWLGIDQDIEKKVGSCICCQNQQPTLPKTTSNPWIWPSKPWQRIHIDFAGPFLNQMFLIVIDAHSKWLEVLKMSSTTSESTINALRYLFSSYGLPEELVSDNGPQFVAEEFEKFLKLNGVKHIKSAPYHPSSNGEAERCVRTFKTAMKTFQKGSLNQKLSAFLLSYRTTPHCTTKVTPAELFLGRRVRTRLDLLKPSLSNTIQKKSSPFKTQYRQIEIGEPVYVQDYRKNQKWVTGVVVEKLGPVTYRVQVENELLWKRHIDQIRKMSFDCEIDEEVKKNGSNECVSHSNIITDSVKVPLPVFENNNSGLQSKQQISVTTMNDQTVSQESSRVTDQSLEGIRRNPARSTRGIPPKRLIIEK